MQRWVPAHPRLRFTAVLSEASDAAAPHHRLGWVHECVLREYASLENGDAWVAGPPGLVESARRDFAAAGLPAERLRFDSFDYAAR